MVYGRAKVKNRDTLSAPARLFIKKLQTSPFFVKRIVYSESSLFCFVIFLLFCYAVKSHRIGIVSVVQAAFDT